MIDFKCPHCNAAIETDDIYAGQQDLCPHCGKNVTVPLGKDLQDHVIHKSKNFMEFLKHKLPPVITKHKLPISSISSMGSFLVLSLIAIIMLVKATEKTHYVYFTESVSFEYESNTSAIHSVPELARFLDKIGPNTEVLAAIPIIHSTPHNYGNSEYVTGLRMQTQTKEVEFLFRRKYTRTILNYKYWLNE